MKAKRNLNLHLVFRSVSEHSYMGDATQSDQGLHCLLTGSLAAIECINGESHSCS